MAQPLDLNLPPRDPRETLFHRLEKAPHEHVEALLEAYELLQGLHDKGILEILRGAIGSGEKVLQIAVDTANTPEVIRGIRNLVILAKLADSIEPELLEDLSQAVPQSLDQVRTQKPLGLFQLMKKLCSQDSRRALTVATRILEAVGRSLGSRKTL